MEILILPYILNLYSIANVKKKAQVKNASYFARKRLNSKVSQRLNPINIRRILIALFIAAFKSFINILQPLTHSLI